GENGDERAEARMGEEGVSADAGERIDVARRAGGSAVFEIGDEALEFGEEEAHQHFLAAFEIAVDVRLGEAGLRRDGVEAGLLRAPRVEELGRGSEDRFAPQLLLR